MPFNDHFCFIRGLYGNGERSALPARHTQTLPPPNSQPRSRAAQALLGLPQVLHAFFPLLRLFCVCCSCCSTGQEGGSAVSCSDTGWKTVDFTRDVDHCWYSCCSWCCNRHCFSFCFIFHTMMSLLDKAAIIYVLLMSLLLLSDNRWIHIHILIIFFTSFSWFSGSVTAIEHTVALTPWLMVIILPYSRKWCHWNPGLTPCMNIVLSISFRFNIQLCRTFCILINSFSVYLNSLMFIMFRRWKANIH